MTTTEQIKSEPKKHQEFILAVHRNYFGEMLVNGKFVEADGETFQQVIPFDFRQFGQDALPHLIVSQRLGLETNSKYRQLLPYFLVTKMGTDGIKRYSKYARAKGSGESRLLGGTSVGYGGHIDVSDIISLYKEIDSDAGDDRDHLEEVPGSIDLCETVLYSQEREADEELVLNSSMDAPQRTSTILLEAKPELLILSKDEKVGQYHVGLVTEVDIFPTDDLSSGEDGAIAIQGWFTIEELLADPKLEDWSRLVLEYKWKYEAVIDEESEENVLSCAEVIYELVKVIESGSETDEEKSKAEQSLGKLGVRYSRNENNDLVLNSFWEGALSHQKDSEFFAQQDRFDRTLEQSKLLQAVRKLYISEESTPVSDNL